MQHEASMVVYELAALFVYKLGASQYSNRSVVFWHKTYSQMINVLWIMFSVHEKPYIYFPFRPCACLALICRLSHFLKTYESMNLLSCSYDAACLLRCRLYFLNKDGNLYLLYKSWIHMSITNFELISDCTMLIDVSFLHIIVQKIINYDAENSSLNFPAIYFSRITSVPCR